MNSTNKLCIEFLKGQLPLLQPYFPERLVVRFIEGEPFYSYDCIAIIKKVPRRLFGFIPFFSNLEYVVCLTLFRESLQCDIYDKRVALTVKGEVNDFSAELRVDRTEFHYPEKQPGEY